MKVHQRGGLLFFILGIVSFSMATIIESDYTGFHTICIIITVAGTFAFMIGDD